MKIIPHRFLARTEQLNHIAYLAAVAFGQHGLHVLAAGSLAFVLLLSLALEVRA